MHRTLRVGLRMTVAAAAAIGGARSLGAQGLAPASTRGRTVTPAFEGWYPNKDGTFSISFGYYNRNSDEVLDIPIGPDNFITPGDTNQGQPTRFYVKRNWGVFAVKVPADFGTKKVVWTLKIRGETFAIAGSLRPEWQIDALEGEAGSGNTPPSLKFSESGPEGSGPGGVTVGPLKATVGVALPVTVWATDDGNYFGSIASDGRPVPVTLAWFKHQGPGEVVFSAPTARLTPTGGKATTSVTFDKPGDYIIRVRANDASGVAAAGHAQCCWTNGFVRVTVSQ
ncbi:MAG TPA: hypothetical protein VN613_07690 [Gemmatimonadaceae bacterium]|nr:hypothetical protein [Gemmatimonadaceae bacterium]